MQLRVPFVFAMMMARRGDGGGGSERRPDAPRVYTDEHHIAHVDRRRHVPRREDDPDEETVKGFLKWARLMVVHKALWAAVLALLSGIAGYVLAAYLLGTRVTNLEIITKSLRADVTELQNTDQLKTFMLCQLTIRLTPDAVPRGCRDYIEPPPLTPRRRSAP